jgi:hypothetical protein
LAYLRVRVMEELAVRVNEAALAFPLRYSV